MIVTKRFPPIPEGFRARFVDPTPRGGWRGVERAYGYRRHILMRFIAQCGGLDALQAERKAARRELRMGGVR